MTITITNYTPLFQSLPLSATMKIFAACVFLFFLHLFVSEGELIRGRRVKRWHLGEVKSVRKIALLRNLDGIKLEDVVGPGLARLLSLVADMIEKTDIGESLALQHFGLENLQIYNPGN